VEKLLRVQRILAIRISMSYRTAATEALFVLARVIPLDLMARERGQTYGADPGRKRTAREDTMNSWHERWENASTGAWTRRLIPNIKKWVEREHGEITSHLSHILTGHGCFEAYKKRIGQTQSAQYRYCYAEEDTCEHTFFTCEKWSEIRQRAENEMGKKIAFDNIVPEMLAPEAKWHIVQKMAMDILTIKEMDEKEEERNSR
jgi:hypothetical protein